MHGSDPKPGCGVLAMRVHLFFPKPTYRSINQCVQQRSCNLVRFGDKISESMVLP
jgi:hypothetical protein